MNSTNPFFCFPLSYVPHTCPDPHLRAYCIFCFVVCSLFLAPYFLFPIPYCPQTTPLFLLSRSSPLASPAQWLQSTRRYPLSSIVLPCFDVSYTLLFRRLCCPLPILVLLVLLFLSHLVTFSLPISLPSYVFLSSFFKSPFFSLRILSFFFAPLSLRFSVPV